MRGDPDPNIGLVLIRQIAEVCGVALVAAAIYLSAGLGAALAFSGVVLVVVGNLGPPGEK